MQHCGMGKACSAIGHLKDWDEGCHLYDKRKYRDAYSMQFASNQYQLNVCSSATNADRSFPFCSCL